MTESSMTPILKTNDQGLLAVVESVLNGAEVPYFVRGREAAGLLPFNATVVVPASFAEQAQELLREAQVAQEPGEPAASE